MKASVLFFIPNLGGGGAEKVLVNLANAINKDDFDVTVLTLYNEGINRQFLGKDVKYDFVLKKRIKGFKHLLKLFSPKMLFRLFIKKQYDCVISYLEGETTRIISGCRYDAKKIAWVHIDDIDDYVCAFRSKREMMKSYEKMDSIVFVSEAAEKAFNEYTNNSFKNKGIIIKNVNNYDAIIRKSEEKTCLDDNNINIICVGRLTKTKDHARLVRIVKKINLRIDNVKLYILGVGKEESNIKNEIRRLGVRNIELLGYDPNPYKYIKQSDLFVCCSHNEGYNTATVEAVVLNTPVVTTDCAGMSEILDSGKYGLIVEDDDGALFDGMYRMIVDEKYRLAIKERQKRHIVSMMRDNAKNIADVEKIIRETSSSWK